MVSLVRFKNTYLILVTSICFYFTSCGQEANKIQVAASRTELYKHLIQGKNIGIIANQTSTINNTHLVDSLLSLGLSVQKVFAPEHGFRGKSDAGEAVKDGIDTATGIPIISLYGKNKKPSAQQLENIDILLFDVQDVGARFYTYISTLHYVMEAAAEAKIPVMVLDRPNPNGHYIDGPILETAHASFVGMHPVPVVYGMTIGEYGQMINGEQWLANGITCELTVIPLKNYTHNSPYSLPIKPSPNLPNDRSINLYPSLCFFEGTNVSAGRGTNLQFQIYGSPYLAKNGFSFKPQPNEGASYPKHKNKRVYGENLSNHRRLTNINLAWLRNAYAQNNSDEFFNSFFTKLAGTKKLQQQIMQGISEKDIKKSWQKGLHTFKKTRAKYLIYK